MKYKNDSIRIDIILYYYIIFFILIDISKEIDFNKKKSLKNHDLSLLVL